MDEIKKIVYDVVDAIVHLEVEDIEVFRKEFIKQLKLGEVGTELISLCDNICDVVITEKRKQKG